MLCLMLELLETRWTCCGKNSNKFGTLKGPTLEYDLMAVKEKWSAFSIRRFDFKSEPWQNRN